MHTFPLGSTDVRACTNITILSDGLVEDEQVFTISLFMNDTSSVTPGSLTRSVIIINSDSKTKDTHAGQKGLNN